LHAIYLYFLDGNKAYSPQHDELLGQISWEMRLSHTVSTLGKLLLYVDSLSLPVETTLCMQVRKKLMETEDAALPYSTSASTTLNL